MKQKYDVSFFFPSLILPYLLMFALHVLAQNPSGGIFFTTMRTRKCGLLLAPWSWSPLVSKYIVFVSLRCRWKWHRTLTTLVGPCGENLLIFHTYSTIDGLTLTHIQTSRMIVLLQFRLLFIHFVAMNTSISVVSTLVVQHQTTYVFIHLTAAFSIYNEQTQCS